MYFVALTTYKIFTLQINFTKNIASNFAVVYDRNLSHITHWKKCQ